MSADNVTCPYCKREFVPGQQWGRWQCLWHPGKLVPIQTANGEYSEFDCCGLIPALAFSYRIRSQDKRGCAPCDHSVPGDPEPRRDKRVLMPQYLPAGQDRERHTDGKVYSSHDPQLDAKLARELVATRMLEKAYRSPLFWDTLDKDMFQAIKQKAEIAEKSAFPLPNYYSGRPPSAIPTGDDDSAIQLKGVADARSHGTGMSEMLIRTIANALKEKDVPVSFVVLIGESMQAAPGVRERIRMAMQ